MSLHSLLPVLLPPEKPIGIFGTTRWDSVESQVGELPSDYKAFVERYGHGTIDRFLWILDPFSPNPYSNLLEQREPILSAIRELRKDCPNQHPYALHPEPRGLLPFGGSDNGDVLSWLTIGEPDRWPVVVSAAREPEYERFECDMTDFLAQVLSKRFRCKIFPESFPSVQPLFVPKQY